MKKMLAIAAGGDTEEAEISFLSAQTVYENIDRSRYTPVMVSMEFAKWEATFEGAKYPIDKNDFSFTAKGKKIDFDYVYISIHGTPGEDGKLQAYFDLLQLPYSSTNHIGATLTFNKWYCNTLLQQLGYKVAQSVYLKAKESYDQNKIIQKLGLPCFVKPCSSGSSYGISKVDAVKDLKKAIDFAFDYDSEIMIESELKGREVTCGVYRKKGELIALPITEIIPKGAFFDYAAKYEGASQEITPAKISDHVRQKTQSIATAVYEKLNLRGISRVDFMLVEDEPYIIELNAVPGMSKESLVPQQLAAANIDLKDFFSDIIEESF